MTVAEMREEAARWEHDGLDPREGETVQSALLRLGAALFRVGAELCVRLEAQVDPPARPPRVPGVMS